MYDRYCKQCGKFVGRTDEFGFCEGCRKVYEYTKLIEGVKKPFKIRVGTNYIP